MHDHLFEAVHTFTQAILNPFDLDDLLHRLLGSAIRTLDAQGAGIMLADNGELDFAASSSDVVGVIERVQERAKTGACYEAFTTNQIIAVEDLESDTRWPDYTVRARRAGFRSVLGVPLNARGQTIGVMNVYRSDPGAWTDDEIRAGTILGDMGAGYILNAAQLQAQHDFSEHLQAALVSRGLIERAKGLLMANLSIDAVSAFETLRERSMNSNQRLRDVARQVLEEAEREV